MRPDLVVIGSAIPQNAAQLRFVEHDQVIFLGLKPRSTREPRPDSKQQLGQKCDHRPLHYHTLTRASYRIGFWEAHADPG